MQQTVSIKSYPDGIHVVLDPDVPFEEIYVTFAEKFRDSAKFFGKARKVFTFDGRDLDDLEERALVEAIEQYSDVTVLCIAKEDGEKNKLFVKACAGFFGDSQSDTCVHKGSIRAKEELSSNGNLIILGDVNPNANVCARGSIVILGTLYGNAFCGTDGDKNTFVAALELKSESVSVAGIVCNDFKKSAGFLRKNLGAVLIYIKNDLAVCEEITKEFIAKLSI